jgi:hypothetical protein
MNGKSDLAKSTNINGMDTTAAVYALRRSVFPWKVTRRSRSKPRRNESRSRRPEAVTERGCGNVWKQPKKERNQTSYSLEILGERCIAMLLLSRPRTEVACCRYRSNAGRSNPENTALSCVRPRLFDVRRSFTTTMGRIVPLMGLTVFSSLFCHAEFLHDYQS